MTIPKPDPLARLRRLHLRATNLVAVVEALAADLKTEDEGLGAALLAVRDVKAVETKLAAKITREAMNSELG